MTEFDKSIRECENSKRIIKNIASLLKKATFSGADAPQVGEGLNYLGYLETQLNGAIEQYRADKKAAKNAPEDSAEPVAKEPATAVVNNG